MGSNERLFKMNISVVTTFHQAGLEKYGQRFITSFEDNVDKKIKMYVYAEDCYPIVKDTDQIIVLDARQTLPKLNKFKETWKNVPKANGKCPWPERRPRDHHKEFKWDAVRFANKVYAVFDASQRCNDWCVWMDADTYVHSPWSYEQFKELLPDDKWMTYVGRGKKAATWPECGFYGMNLNNKVCIEFLKQFEHVYENAETGIFQMEEWHDSYVFGIILNRMKIDHPNVYDYTEGFMMKTAHTGGGGHPLINTELGRWIDHMKGARKNTGKSLSKDLIEKRQEAYWGAI